MSASVIIPSQLTAYSHTLPCSFNANAACLEAVKVKDNN